VSTDIFMRDSEVAYATIKPENKVFFSVSGEGVLTLGPDLTWDEAAELFLEAVEKQIGRRIVAVHAERKADPTPAGGDEP
jgi:hypothetical protein